MVVSPAPSEYPTWPSSTSSADSRTQVEYLTVQEAAELSGRSRSTIDYWIRQAKLPAEGRPRRFSSIDFERLNSQAPRRQPAEVREPRTFWKRLRDWFMKWLALNLVLVAVLGGVTSDYVSPVPGILFDKGREAFEYHPEPIIDADSPHFRWMRWAYDPENPPDHKSGLRLDVCTQYNYFAVESWELLPDGSERILYPEVGTPPEFFPAVSEIQCREGGPREIDPPRWPVAKLEPGNIVRIRVSLYISKDFPPSASYLYVFEMGERDIKGGRVDGDTAPTGMPSVSLPVATPPVTPDAAPQPTPIQFVDRRPHSKATP